MRSQGIACPCAGRRSGGRRATLLRLAALALLAVFLMISGATTAPCQQVQPDGHAPSQVAPHPRWTEAERWAWARLQDGEMADLNAHCGELDNSGGARNLDPRQDEGMLWAAECRTVGTTFIRRMLTEEPWRGRLENRGLWIAGARVAEHLDLSGLKISAAVRLEWSRFDSGVNLTARVSKGTVLPAIGLRGDRH